MPTLLPQSDEEVPRVSWWSTDDPRRLTAVVALVLAAAALVGLGVGFLLSVAGDGRAGTTVAREPSPLTSPTTTSPPAARPTTRAASEIERGTTSDIGYFIGAQREGDGTHVTFDRVLLKMGKDARDYARRYHKKKPGPDGILLVNDNDLTRDLVLAPDVSVLGTQSLAGSQDPKPVPLRALLDMVASHGDTLLLDLTYDKLGYVVKVQEHDLP
jgi:hypothetical protein